MLRHAEPAGLLAPDEDPASVAMPAVLDTMYSCTYRIFPPIRTMHATLLPERLPTSVAHGGHRRSPCRSMTQSANKSSRDLTISPSLALPQCHRCRESDAGTLHVRQLSVAMGRHHRLLWSRGAARDTFDRPELAVCHRRPAGSAPDSEPRPGQRRDRPRTT